jgi:hypothetical protein
MKGKKERVNRITRLKIENFVLLIVSIIIAYFFLNSIEIKSFIDGIGKYVYLVAFIIGFFLDYGFLTVPSISILYLISKKMDPLSIAMIASLSATISNLLIFSFAKFSLVTEIELLAKELNIKIKKLKINRSWLFLIPTISGFLIASPLPDEINTSLFESVEYDISRTLVLSYIFNITLIYVILYITMLI